MLLGIVDDRMFFEAIGTDDRVIDCGLLWRTPDAEARGADAESRAWLDRCKQARPGGADRQRRFTVMAQRRWDVRAAGVSMLVLLFLMFLPWPVLQAQPPAPTTQMEPASQPGPLPSSPQEEESYSWAEQMTSLKTALIRLPIATGLSAVLAFRPRRRGTPARQVAVIQTQIILAIVGAMVMLVVGASLARAFGIVGAAGLIRYRAKIDDPKDAGVMLSTLALGLAAGVGLYSLAVFATVFVLGVLWVLESIEPEPYTVFHLTVAMKNAADMRPQVEKTLRRFRLAFELRGSSAEDVSYEVKVPTKRNTDNISTAIAAIDPEQTIDVKWEKKKDK